MFPDLSFEKKLWSKEFSLVIGVDEVGRGALAGPVVAGACALQTQNSKLPLRPRSEASKNQRYFDELLKLGVNDSKKLSAGKREKLVPQIKKYFYCGIGESGVEFINKLV